LIVHWFVLTTFEQVRDLFLAMSSGEKKNYEMIPAAQ
jgi:hypothetical protein